MKNKQILIILIVIVAILIVLMLKNKRENFKATPTCSASVTIEPLAIEVIPGQPLMLRAYQDSDQLGQINYIKPPGPSICNWFQGGNMVNVNYSTSVVCQGYINDTNFGLMYFPLKFNFDMLPLFTPTTNIIGNGVYTMIGYGTSSLLNDANYYLLQSGTVVVNTLVHPPIQNIINASCVQHYYGPVNYSHDDNGNNWYTYDVSIQFSYNIY